jgi:hypothetical protein
LGGNIFKNNGEFDLPNGTEVKICAVGNQLNSSRVKGLFDLDSVRQTPTLGGVKFSDISTHAGQGFYRSLGKDEYC